MIPARYSSVLDAIQSEVVPTSSLLLYFWRYHAGYRLSAIYYVLNNAPFPNPLRAACCCCCCWLLEKTYNLQSTTLQHLHSLRRPLYFLSAAAAVLHVACGTTISRRLFSHCCLPLNFIRASSHGTLRSNPQSAVVAVCQS